MRLAAVLALASFCCAAADLGDRVREILNGSPEAAQCFWGIRVVDAESGELLFSVNENKFFIPASNTKLFTTSLALRIFGPDYKFRTRVEADATPDANGRVRELRLIGGGDPNLSARLLPYNRDETGPDPLAAIKQLADQVVAKGIRVVDGDLVGDDTAYVWDPYPAGWALDDPVFEYGAPVSALTVNDNAFTLTVAPGDEPGAPAKLSAEPPVEYLVIHNRTGTIAAGPARITFDRIPGSRELVVSGTILQEAEPRAVLLAIDDPALFAAYALRDALEKRGVRFTGEIRSVHRYSDHEAPSWSGVEIAVHESAPLAQIVQVINKVSQNLHTEILLNEIARAKAGVGSRKEGLHQIAAYLGEIGVEEGQWNFEDASGLSRLTLVTPLTITKLLSAMYQSPLRDVWIATLPIGGVDGTLEKRFRRNPEAARIHAKTGSISHVSALSGYAQREDGRTRVFSIMANNYNAPAAAIRAVIDRIALALLE